jgi:hypothetical protein
LEVVTQVSVVFQALISKDFENKFLTVSNQRYLVRILSIERLIECGVVVDSLVNALVVFKWLIWRKYISYIVNICLNNYCKRAADRSHSSKTKAKVLSKVSTYHK